MTPELYASAQVTLRRYDGSTVTVDIPEGNRVEATFDPRGRALGPVDFGEARRFLPGIEGADIHLKITRGPAAAVLATQTITPPKADEPLARKVLKAAEKPLRQAFAVDASSECMEGAFGFGDTDQHDGCPCRKTGRHRVHRCDHGTEWWRNEPRSET